MRFRLTADPMASRKTGKGFGYGSERKSPPMHYYFHILTDSERHRDPDGEECSSLDLAREEATQSARDLIAEELRCGRQVPSQWRIQIALEDEVIVETVAFTSLLLDHKGSPPHPRPQVSGRMHAELFARANATFTRTQNTTVEIWSHLIELRDNLERLGQFDNAFTNELLRRTEPGT